MYFLFVCCFQIPDRNQKLAREVKTGKGILGRELHEKTRDLACSKRARTER